MPIPEGHAFVAGRSRDRARLLLDAAAELGLTATVVRTQVDGYIVPSEVADLVANAAAGEAADEVEVVIEPDSAPAEQGATQPAKNGSKAAWAEWAAATQGYDPEEDLSRDALIDRYGGSQ